jgi:hypothetical protein
MRNTERLERILRVCRPTQDLGKYRNGFSTTVKKENKQSSDKYKLPYSYCSIVCKEKGTKSNEEIDY